MKEQYQVLTQAFVARRVMSDADLTTLVNQLNQACPGLSHDEASVENMVTTVNEQLRTLSLEIRKAVAESDALVYWGLVNLRLDTHLQGATTLSVQELAFFKRVIDTIVSEPAGHIDLTAVVAIGRELNPPLSATKAQSLLDDLCTDQWLVDMNRRRNKNNNNNNNNREDRERKITLGVRSMLELRFEEAFQDELKDCILCSEPVVLRQEKGTRCSNARCSSIMHIFCKDKWFHGKKDRRCPTCTTPWPSD